MTETAIALYCASSCTAWLMFCWRVIPASLVRWGWLWCPGIALILAWSLAYVY